MLFFRGQVKPQFTATINCYKLGSMVGRCNHENTGTLKLSVYQRHEHLSWILQWNNEENALSTYCCLSRLRKLCSNVCGKQMRHALSNNWHGQYKNHSFEGFYQTNNISSHQSSVSVSIYPLSIHPSAAQSVVFQP